MIVSFKDKRAKELFEDLKPRGFPSDLIRVARRKLLMLDAATILQDLRNPPGNHLEALKRERKGWHSIRINDQWRICFRFENGCAFDVEILDYH